MGWHGRSGDARFSHLLEAAGKVASLVLREEEGSLEIDGLIHSTQLWASPLGSIHYSSSFGKKSSPARPQIRALASAAAGTRRVASPALVPGGDGLPVQRPGTGLGTTEGPGEDKALPWIDLQPPGKLPFSC